MLEKSSAVALRCVVECVAGPREWGDTRESWLSRVPRAVKKVLCTERETVSFRAVKSIWYGEIADPEHHAVRDIRRAAEILAARREALDLARKYQAIARAMNASDQNFFGEDIARLERVARMLCGEDRTD